MYESAQRVSATNSNFYAPGGDVGVQTRFQNLPPEPEATSSYPPIADFYYGFGSGYRLPSTDPWKFEGGGEAAAEGDRSEDYTPSFTPTLTVDLFSAPDPDLCGKMTGVPSVKRKDNGNSVQTLGSSSAQYWPLPSPTYATSVTFAKIAFKMDMEELKARMQTKERDVNPNNLNATMSGSFLKDVNCDPTPGASSSSDAIYGARPRINTPPNQNPRQMAEKDSYTSSSLSSSLATRRRKSSRLPKPYERRIPRSNEDSSQVIQASSSAKSGTSKPLIGIYGKASSARLNAVSRRTAERGTRRPGGLTSERFG